MKMGVDLVKIADVTKRLSGSVASIFTESELISDTNKRAGIVAIKEAFFKAIGRKDDWLSVWVEHEETGKPLLRSTLLRMGESVEVSVSYAGEYVVAVVIIFSGYENTP